MVKSWRGEIQKIYEEISSLEPTYEEIEDFVEWLEGPASYGVVTYAKRDDNPLSIGLHDT